MNTRNLWAIILVTFILIKVKCLAIFFKAVDECPNPLIKFYLYTNETPILLDPKKPDASQFLYSRKLIILLHGYNGDLNAPPNAEVRSAMLQTQTANVITADYGALVPAPNYFAAVQNGDIIAKCLAQLINNLIDKEIVKKEQLHLIGFSLGAQFAGITANYVTTPLCRITGLDPAGPLYDTEMLDSKKLDASDATFVDVVHTDPVVYGTKYNCGHVDTFVNDRSYPQNGCGSTFMDDKCSHFRAPIYYAESITTQSGFRSSFCGSRMEYSLGRCSPYASYEKVLMGYFTPTNSTSGTYFVNTNAAAPFAQGG